MRKAAEKRVRELTNYHGWYRHKYGDVRYCPYCRHPLPKSEKAPDFYVSQVGDWIEAKNSDSTGTWKCSELYEGGEREAQREFLLKNHGWLFIELGTGNAPANKQAWLVSFLYWVDIIEPTLHELNMMSIRRLTTSNKDGSVRRPGADLLLRGYELAWLPKEGWYIEAWHPYWKHLSEKLRKEFVKTLQKGTKKCQ